ncbi:MAG: hypothetical protein IKP65_04430 [Alphaproteobacteria bacterium]|nr:hypothetical protein [Alphaproteobacteria bacterium]
MSDFPNAPLACVLISSLSFTIPICTPISAFLGICIYKKSSFSSSVYNPIASVIVPGFDLLKFLIYLVFIKGTCINIYAAICCSFAVPIFPGDACFIK